MAAPSFSSEDFSTSAFSVAAFAFDVTVQPQPPQPGGGVPFVRRRPRVQERIEPRQDVALRLFAHGSAFARFAPEARRDVALAAAARGRASGALGAAAAEATRLDRAVREDDEFIEIG